MAAATGGTEEGTEEEEEGKNHVDVVSVHIDLPSCASSGRPLNLFLLSSFGSSTLLLSPSSNCPRVLCQPFESDENDGGVGTVEMHLRQPLVLHVVQRGRTHHRVTCNTNKIEPTSHSFIHLCIQLSIN